MLKKTLNDTLKEIENKLHSNFIKKDIHLTALYNKYRRGVIM